MAKQNTCETCRYLGPMVKCQRHAPVYDPKLSLGTWPQTNLGATCGDYELDSEHDNSLSEPASNDGKPSISHQIANQMIAEQMLKKPNDSPQDIAGALDCWAGIVMESSAWKLNQKFLKMAKP